MQTFDYAGEGFTNDGYYPEEGYEEQNCDATGAQEDFYEYASSWSDYAIVLLCFV